MEVGGPDEICGAPPSEDENAGPVSSSFSLRTNPQLLQTISPLSSSLTKVPFFPQFGHFSGISSVPLSTGSWRDDNRERLTEGNSTIYRRAQMHLTKEIANHRFTGLKVVASVAD